MCINRENYINSNEKLEIKWGRIRMAKKIKFPLEMSGGIQVHTIEELREYFDLDENSWLLSGWQITYMA